ncbi:energy transducer TonB [Massilia sp. Se16.2.3]|uniref:energy transducer TonB n=1 Tax=Massilia sp. Se16.2.3 TaxID=2709303 RepID=UPI001E63177B|nr:energy transducer TonB [Massilia sp. Se16.2.3]
MEHRTLSLVMLPPLLATLAGCATAPAAPPAIAATPAAIVFGSCPQKPAWPEAAQRERRRGSVGLAFLVGPDNAVLDAKVKASSGHADLDEAARTGLAKCKFKAATQNGQPVRDWAELKYVWTL